MQGLLHCRVHGTGDVIAVQSRSEDYGCTSSIPPLPSPSCLPLRTMMQQLHRFTSCFRFFASGYRVNVQHYLLKQVGITKK